MPFAIRPGIISYYYSSVLASGAASSAAGVAGVSVSATGVSATGASVAGTVSSTAGTASVTGAPALPEFPQRKFLLHLYSAMHQVHAELEIVIIR